MDTVPQSESPGPAEPKAPLGNTTKKPSRAARKRKKHRHERFGLREVLREITSRPRVRICGIRKTDATKNVDVRCRITESGEHIAHYGNLMLCGSIWLCPVCGPRIRQERAVELDLACAQWMREHGQGSIMFLTLTAPHEYGERLADLLQFIREGFSRLVSGRAWKDDKAQFGLKQYVKAHDTTVGPNGWHPHLHIVLLAELPLDDHELRDLEERLFQRWRAVLIDKANREPSKDYGIRLERARSVAEATNYVCQVVCSDEPHHRSVAYETARGDLKRSSHAGHRTPWQVLADFVETGLADDLILWHEWEKATKGTHAIRWSNGMRKDLGMGTERTDEEIVEADIGGEPVFQFTDRQWVRISHTRGAQATVLSICEDGGRFAVEHYVKTLCAHTSRINYLPVQ